MPLVALYTSSRPAALHASCCTASKPRHSISEQMCVHWTITRQSHGPYFLLAAKRLEARRKPATCCGLSVDPAVIRNAPTGLASPSSSPISPKAMEIFRGVAAASLRTLPATRSSKHALQALHMRISAVEQTQEVRHVGVSGIFSQLV